MGISCREPYIFIQENRLGLGVRHIPEHAQFKVIVQEGETAELSGDFLSS